MKNAERKTETLRAADFRRAFFAARRSAFIVILFFLSATAAFAQNYPKEIRGYKVYDAKISIGNLSEKANAKNESEAFVEIGEPKITDASLSGVEFEISPQIKSADQSGAVDFLAFKDFRVQGLAVEADEYREPFTFKKNQLTPLPKSIKIRVGASSAVRGALSALKFGEKEWTIAGTIFVFGRFKRFGFAFKRVVPIEVNLKIKNPLLSANNSR